MIQPHLESTHVRVKMSDVKSPATESSECIGKARKKYVPEDPKSDTKTAATDYLAQKRKSQKEYVPEDPESDPSSSESPSSKSDLSEKSYY